MRLVTDTIEFGTRELPRWNTISISGYHIREAGSTAVQELAFTIADGMAYVEAALERGLRIDDFAPRLSFFFNSHSDFFEEIAKFRASPAHLARPDDRALPRRERALGLDALPHPDRWRVPDPAAAAQQPDPGRDPGAGGVLGGTQSLHTDAYDEALAVPTAEAALLALRQQQVIAEESGVDADGRPARRLLVRRGADRRDRAPGAGATSTRSTDAAAWSRPITEGYPQREIADAAYRYQREFDAGERRVVGVNAYVDESRQTRVPVLAVPPGSLERHMARLERTRRSATRTRSRPPCAACATRPHDPGRATRT